MEIFYSPYQLTPLRKANALADTQVKSGVLLWAKRNDFEVADYFPHQELGDESVEEFLETFPNQSNSYHQSVLHQLLQPKKPINHARFYNHQLIVAGTEVQSPVVKVKIAPEDKTLPASLMQSSCRLRLDANGLFSQTEIFKFFAQFTVTQLERIDYIEDPTAAGRWNDLPVKAARDFIQGEPHEVVIYKPNRHLLEGSSKKIIFSSYMGSSYGLLHVYRELMRTGDLNEFHGLLTPGLYLEEKPLFQGSYQTGFEINKHTLREMESDLAHRQWRQLCTL